ncbi:MULTISPECIES: hypothetical protein [Rhizobium/Agrobacterium group]|uniref:hypothetical protein n=2 Tax=Rhizobiaceae TaxID=82115 RepID=UPI001159AD37|nr:MULTISPECIES: hypothetical protein [Rhizobium/Agrobacterium group]
MQPLGIIPDERLQYMPRDIIPRHEYCFWLHDEITRLLVEATQSGHVEFWHDLLQDALRKNGQSADDESIWTKVAEAGGIVSTPIKLDILLGLIADTMHFIYEALTAFEKRKFNVAYALLRKPLTENLIIISKLIQNDDALIKSFADGSLQTKQVMQIDPKDCVSLFDGVIKDLYLQDFATGDLIYKIIFDKKTPNGLQLNMQKSMHLITTRHPALATPKFGLNRIFHYEHGDDNYNVYNTLPILLFFILQISLKGFSKYFQIHEITVNEILIRSVGLFGNLYEGGLDSLSRSLNKQINFLFKCEWCDQSDVKIRKKYAPLFYLKDQVHCKNCERLSHTPFTYLLRSGALNLFVEKSGKLPSEYAKLIPNGV